MNSTSIHKLNADKGLSRYRRCLWLLLNWLSNSFFPNARDRNLAVRDFVADISDDSWNRTHIKSSPSRKLGDLFWLQLPWAAIRSELGPIHVLDTGCGSGNYGVRLRSYSNDSIASYTGLDLSAHDNWSVLSEEYPNFQFRTRDSSDISDCIPDDTNFFISQSAIEHFDNDLLFFQRIREFAMRTSRTIIQVHLFPSSACLGLYLTHGVRQYTPRTVSRIARLFDGFSYSMLYRLGGRECNRIHWEFITSPQILHKGDDLRNTCTQEYDRRLRHAVARDNNSLHRQPSFYALVIHSNWKETILR